MPYDCASACVSWDAEDAFVIHDWASSSLSPSLSSSSFVRGSSILVSKPNSDVTNCDNSPSMCGDGACILGVDSLGIGFDGVTGQVRPLQILNFTYSMNQKWINPGTFDSIDNFDLMDISSLFWFPSL